MLWLLLPHNLAPYYLQKFTLEDNVPYLRETVESWEINALLVDDEIWIKWVHPPQFKLQEAKYEEKAPTGNLDVAFADDLRPIHVHIAFMIS